MFQGIYNSAAAADAFQKWNDVIARNITASATPGFKRDVLTFNAAILGTVGFRTEGDRGGQMAAQVPVSSTGINFTKGDVQYSGDSMEFAIDGEGFFKLQGLNGENVYTRDGQFRVSATGQLISKQGFPVIGESGPVQVLIDQGPVALDEDGRLLQGTQEIGVLTVYDVKDRTALRRGPGGFVIDPNRSGIEVEPVEEALVRQGFVERSNVSAVTEMVELVSVANSLQANQKMIQTIDELSGRAIQTLSTAS